MGSGSACMARTGTSRSCHSGPARQGARRHVVGKPDAVGGSVAGVAGRLHGRSVHRQDSGLPRVFVLLRDVRSVLLHLGEAGSVHITPWADRGQSIDAEYVGIWELPVLGAAPAPTAALIRPDGYAAWVGDLTQFGLADTVATWFCPP